LRKEETELRPLSLASQSLSAKTGSNSTARQAARSLKISCQRKFDDRQPTKHLGISQNSPDFQFGVASCTNKFRNDLFIYLTTILQQALALVVQ